MRLMAVLWDFSTSGFLVMEVLLYAGRALPALVALSGAVVCYLNSRLSRYLWLVTLGFLLLSGLIFWNVAITFLVSHQLIEVRLLGGFSALTFVGSLSGWLAIVVGLTLVFRDVRAQLENYKAAWQLSAEETKGENIS